MTHNDKPVVAKDGRRWTRKMRLDAMKKKSKSELITSIVQASQSKSSNIDNYTSCLTNIPKAVCRLMGIKAGSLISWELSKYELNTFVIRVLDEDSNITEEGDR